MDTPRRRTHPALPPLLCSVAALSLFAAACTSGPTSGPNTMASAAPGAAVVSASPTVSTQLQDDYQRVVRDVLPSVVQITTQSGLGTGIVYDGKGDVVTNAHVVGGSKSFQVTLANSKRTLDAALVGSYPDDDLAVIRLIDPPAGLHQATFADSSKVEVGQIVLAMGNPLGLSSSVTQGIVSAVGRTVTEPASDYSSGATIPNMVQTSAAINPGNSGGALANLSSQVIGINTLAAVDQELGGGAAPGIGFAIPSSIVTLIADQLIRSGRVTDSGRAALGVTVRTVLTATASGFNPAGAVIDSVSAGGPAARAGLREGDIITGLDGSGIDSADSLTQALASESPGDRVQISYTRGRQHLTAAATLGTLKSS